MCTCKRLLTFLVGLIAIIIGYGIILSNTPPPEINPKHIIQDDGKYITTSNNRIVEYFVYGSTQSNASILVEIAGGLMTAKFYTKIPGLREYYIQHNIKAIAITLPGWGYSSLNPKRKYVDWPKTDLEPILKAENVDKFTVSGLSLGAPHAMAAAYYFGPKGRITAMGLRVPFLGIPLSEEEELPYGQPSVPTHVIFDKTWYSWSIHLLFQLFSKIFATPSIMRYMFPSKLIEEYPELSELVLDDLIRGQSYSGYHGFMQCMSYGTILDWGFDIRKLKGVSKIVVWYALDDDDCPPSHGKWISEYFDKKEDVEVKVRVFDGYGHVGAGIVEYAKYVWTLVDN